MDLRLIVIQEEDMEEVVVKVKCKDWGLSTMVYTIIIHITIHQSVVQWRLYISI